MTAQVNAFCSLSFLSTFGCNMFVVPCGGCLKGRHGFLHAPLTAIEPRRERQWTRETFSCPIVWPKAKCFRLQSEIFVSHGDVYDSSFIKAFLKTNGIPYGENKNSILLSLNDGEQRTGN